ncbi:MAG TPA: hypothetical protein VIM97_13000, partial [Actinomycetes bacterium]
ATAKAAYKARLGKPRADLEEARSGNDPVRASGARAELDFLAAELARAGWAAATGEAEPLAFDGWLELLGCSPTWSPEHRPARIPTQTADERRRGSCRS